MLRSMRQGCAYSGRYRGIQWGDTFAELASYARIRWGEC